MEPVQVGYAKAHLCDLLKRVERGEQILISRRGKVIARLIPETRREQTASEALAPVWALGGFDLEPAPEFSDSASGASPR